MHFWEKVKILLFVLIVMASVVTLTGCGMGNRGEIVPSGQNFGLPERTDGDRTMLVASTEVGPNIAEQEKVEGTAEAKRPLEGMSWGSAFLEDQEFLYFYSGCKIWKISKESKEAAVLWESSHTEEVSLSGEAILLGDRIFFIENWWSLGRIRETFSVIHTDGTGYECIEEKEIWFGGNLYFADGILYVHDYKTVWKYRVYTDGTWDKMENLTEHISEASPETLKAEIVTFSNKKYFLDIQDENLYLTDKETQEGRYLAECNGRVIGMDDEYIYLRRKESGGDGEVCIVYEKIAIKDGERSTLFLQDGFSNIFLIHDITGTYGMSQIADGYIYYVEETDYKLYLARRSLDDPSNREILGEAFFDSGIGAVGRVENYSVETLSEVNPDWGHVSVELERLVVEESFPGAADINRSLTEVQENIILYEEQNFLDMEKYLKDTGEKLASAAEREGVNFREHYSYNSVLSSVFCYGDRWLSFYQEDDDYTGGAHGSLYRKGYTFDLLTGKRLALGDVVGNSEEEINTIVTQYFELYINEEPEAFWEDAMDIVREGIGMESDFYLKEEGICFYFPPYAIASFAAGFPEVTVPYEKFEIKISFEERDGRTQSDAEPASLFPQELVNMLEEAFLESGWRGVRELIEAGNQQSGADGQEGTGDVLSGTDSQQIGSGSAQPEAGSQQNGLDSAQLRSDEQQALIEVGDINYSEIFQHFPLINEYKDRMIYEYEPYEAVSYLYQGPKELEFIYYLPERDRGKYALVYESGKSGGKRAYSVRLADLVNDVFVTAAEFDVQNDIGEVFLYKGEYYYIYGWKSGVSEEKGYDGFMLHKLSGNPKRETLLGCYAPEGEFVLTEREIFVTEKESDLFTPSERRVGQFGYIVYDNRWDFEEERNLPYADDWTFEKLKEAYGELDLYGEFQQNDSETNVIYIEAFRKLVHNEVTFYDRESDKNYYLRDYEGVQLDIKEEGVYDPGRFEYYLFDADGNGFPELGILEEYPDGHSAFLYLFRYDVDTGQYSLWINLYPPYDRLLGTRKVLMYDGVHMKIDYGYYQLDQEGEVECKAYLYYLPIRMFEQLCLVMLPAHSDPGLDADVTLRMEKYGIYAREPGEWYFRVTEEQFEELETILMDAYKESKKKGEAVLYTYEELFGEREIRLY